MNFVSAQLLLKLAPIITFLQSLAYGKHHFILMLVFATKPVILDILFTLRHIQAIFYCQFPAYSVVSYAVIAVAYGFTVIVHTVYYKMYMRMLSIVMPYNNILCVFDIHLFHIFPGNLYH